MQGTWDGSGHFWTLSVEEQFYLLWFMIIMLVRRRFLPAILQPAASYTARRSPKSY